MKPRSSNQTNRALTLVEVLLVIVLLAVIVVMLIPVTGCRMQKADRINCVNNLKEIGLAYKVWAGDNNDKFPMQVSITDTNGGGTMELANGKNAWINFYVMSNELSTPRILICPADKDRIAATNFTTDFNNSKISYFVGLNADQDHPQSFLSGDDNFAINGVSIKSGLVEFQTNSTIVWTTARHNRIGNIVLADGSVQKLNNPQLPSFVQATGLATNRLAIP